MKILIINPFGIGDVIFSTPMIEILRRKFPDSFIGYVCNKRTFDVIKTNPHLDRVFIYEKDEYRNAWQRSGIEYFKMIWSFLMLIKRENFDMAIDLSLGYQYSMLLALIGVKKRIGFSYRNRGRFLTGKITINGFHDKHVIDYYLDLLRLIDIDVEKYMVEPRVYLPENTKTDAGKFPDERGIAGTGPVIGIMAGCGASWGIDAKYRRWDKGKFACLADRLVEKHKAKVIFFGDKKDAELYRDIEGLVKNKVINLCGKTSIPEFMEFLKKCDLLITNDGGPLHMAVGLGVKTVSIFGPVDEAVYGPYKRGPDHAVVSKNGMPCRPCYKGFKYDKCENRLCLDSITVDDVLTASEEILLKGSR